MWRASCVAIALVSVALPAQAAAEGGLEMFLKQTGNLILLLGVLFYVGRKPLRKFFAERRSQIRADLDEASGLLAEAERRYADWQRKLIQLEQEVETITREGRLRAEEEAEAILANAEAAAERIHRDAASSAAHELRRAQETGRYESLELRARPGYSASSG